MTPTPLTRRQVTAAATLAVMASACGKNSTDGAATSTSGAPATTGAAKAVKLKVFATTGYLGDVVKNLDPEAEITVMVGPGGDPHTYQASTKDIEKLKAADVVVWNGLHLEAHMIDQLRSLGAKQLEVGEKVPKDLLLPWPEKDDKGNDLHDPHIWNSPQIWKNVVGQVADKLSSANASQAKSYKEKAGAYTTKIDELDAKNKTLLGKIPPERRLLVTGHDAFNYFGKHYGIEVEATDFVTSEADFSAQDLDKLATTIAQRKIPIIFQDNLKNAQAVRSLEEAVKAKGGKVKVSDKPLYADSLGEEAPVDTYLGVFEYNAKTITDALVGA